MVPISVLLAAMSAGMFMSASVAAVETKPHKIGDTVVTSMITSSFGYGDNVFRGSSLEESSSFISITPTVEAVRETLHGRLSFGYQGNGVAFFDSSDDSYLSNELSGGYVRKLSSISEFSVGASLEDGNTPRGTDSTEGTNGEARGSTEFTRKDFALGYRVGSEKVGPSLELGYKHADLEFDNFEIINQGRDYSLEQLSARVGYQYSVATQFFVELSKSDFDYSSAGQFLGDELDGSEQALLLGVKWKLSRLTEGEISIGTIDKELNNFQDPRSLTSWKVLLGWTPNTRDTISVEGFSRPFEQAGTGTFQEIEQLTAKWERQLSRTFSVVGGLTTGSVNFNGVARRDDFTSATVGMQYRPTRYSEWALNYEYEDKDSTLTNFVYDSNVLFLSYAVSL